MNVMSSSGDTLPDTAVSMNVLLGDVDASKRVDNTDVNLVRDQLGNPVTASNFREDVNTDGSID